MIVNLNQARNLADPQDFTLAMRIANEIDEYQDTQLSFDGKYWVLGSYGEYIADSSLARLLVSAARDSLRTLA